jgi:hypothetical protein
MAWLYNFFIIALMASFQQEELSLPSLEYRLPSPPSFRISSSGCLQVPHSRPSKRLLASRRLKLTASDTFATSLPFEEQLDHESKSYTIEPSPETAPPVCLVSPGPPYRPIPLSERVYMSVYSNSSVDTDLSEFSNPPARSYRTSTSQKMSRKINVVCLHLA